MFNYLLDYIKLIDLEQKNSVLNVKAEITRLIEDKLGEGLLDNKNDMIYRYVD